MTGAAGYIGAAAVQELLQAGKAVRALDCLNVGGESLLSFWGHPKLEFLRGDITDEGLRRKALVDVESVVHLAAMVGDPACKQQPELARRINLEASCQLGEEARAAGVLNFIFVSTCSNYGLSDPNTLASEESPLRPLSLYAETKVAVEQYLLERSDGMAVTVLRLATVYGVAPRMRFDLTVNEFARDAVLRGQIQIYGEQHYRPYVHVRDVARAIVTVLASPDSVRRGQIFNVGDTEENYSKRALGRLLQERLPNLKIDYVASGPDPRSYRVNFGKIRSVLGFAPRYRVPDGMDQVISLVRSGIPTDPYEARWRNT